MYRLHQDLGQQASGAASGAPLSHQADACLVGNQARNTANAALRPLDDLSDDAKEKVCTFLGASAIGLLGIAVAAAFDLGAGLALIVATALSVFGEAWMTAQISTLLF